MDAKVAALLGFARKAKQLVSGEAAAEAILKKGQAKLLILAGDISSKLAQKYTLWCQDERVPVMVMGDKHSLGIALGASPRSVIVITDYNFAQSILRAGGMSGDKKGFQ